MKVRIVNRGSAFYGEEGELVEVRDTETLPCAVSLKKLDGSPVTVYFHRYEILEISSCAA